MPPLLPPLLIDILPNGVTHLGGAQFTSLHRSYLLCAAIAEALLVYDWVAQFPAEMKLVWKPSKGALGYAFLFSRYLGLFWAVFVGMSWLSVMWYPTTACSLQRIFPVGFSIVLCSAHVCLIIRVWSLWECSKTLLIGLLGLTAACLCVEIVADLFVQPLLLSSKMVAAFSFEYRVCFLSPSSPVFGLCCILPSVLGHVCLALTLFKSIAHIRATNSPVVKTLQQDQIFFVSLICLANFVNVVLVLQPSWFYYKTVNYLPAMVITQILLARIVFNLRQLSSQLAVQHLSLVLVDMPKDAEASSPSAPPSFVF